MRFLILAFLLTGCADDLAVMRNPQGDIVQCRANNTGWLRARAQTAHCVSGYEASGYERVDVR